MNIYTSEVEMLRAECKEWEKVCDQHLRHIAKLKKRRAWVGLTDEDISDIWHNCKPYYDEDDFAKAIEAKLKEKNNG